MDFEFEKDLKTANQIAGTENRLLYWKRRFKESKQFDEWDVQNFRGKVKAEIEFLEFELSVKTEQRKLYENTFNQTQRESLTDTFEKIKNGWLSELEQIRFIEEITDNYELEKLKALEHDLSFFIFMEKEERIAEITEEEKEKKFNKYWEQGKRLPTHRDPIKFNAFDDNTNKADKWELKNWGNENSIYKYYRVPEKTPKELNRELVSLSMRLSLSRLIDMEKTFFPYEFWLIYKFRNLVQTKIMQVGSDEKAYIRKELFPEIHSKKESKYPKPKEVAKQYHIEKGSKHKEYTAEQIAPVMEVTKNYIEENPGLRTIHGHIKTITDKCKGLPGGRDAKSNWIKFYAEKAGLETI